MSEERHRKRRELLDKSTEKTMAKAKIKSQTPIAVSWKRFDLAQIEADLKKEEAFIQEIVKKKIENIRKTTKL